MHLCTDVIQKAIRDMGMQEGLCFLYIQHTSASLVISEDFDPSARMDMEQFMEHIAPEREPWYRHTMEGADDSPSHIRSMLTACSEMIPVEDGRLALGTWQGIYLFEHRRHPHTRTILLRCIEMD